MRNARQTKWLIKFNQSERRITMGDRDITAIAGDIRKTGVALQEYIEALRDVPANELMYILQKFPWVFFDLARELENRGSSDDVSDHETQNSTNAFH
jgi:hypothetical protein